MANITRVFTPANIFISPADLYFNLAAPASSLVPTADNQCLVLDASGQPSSATGFHAGLVEAPTMPTITEKANEIHADQSESPIDVGLQSIEAEIDCNVKELNLSRLQTFLSSAGLSVYTALAASQAWQIGGQLDASISQMTVTAIATRRDVAGKFAYWMLYKAILTAPIQMVFSRAKEHVYKLKFKGFMDPTRVLGDEVMQICRQK